MAATPHLAATGHFASTTFRPTRKSTSAGNQQQSGHYIGPVQISLTATDNASGVAITYLSVDFGQFQTYSGPVISYMPGFHCAEAYSVDVAGNQEGGEEQCFNIDSNSQFTLTVSKPGTGGGTVTSTDGGINCGSTCSGPYYDEQPVTLTAAPQAGSLFTGWRNCDLSFGFSCTLTVTAARNCDRRVQLPVALQFVPLTPCRVVDTRQANGPFGGPAISGGTSRNFALPAGPCPNIPSNAAAYSAECDDGAAGISWVLDRMADRLYAAADVDHEFLRWPHQGKCGDRSGGRQEFGQRVRQQYCGRGARHRRLFRRAKQFHAGLLPANALSSHRYAQSERPARRPDFAEEPGARLSDTSSHGLRYSCFGCDRLLVQRYRHSCESAVAELPDRLAFRLAPAGRYRR